MSLYKMEAKAKRSSRKPSFPADQKMQRAEELLKEVDSLALLLEEVKRQSQRIQAAADAIGEELFASPHAKASASVLNAQSTPENMIGPKLVPSSGSAQNSPGNTRNNLS